MFYLFSKILYALVAPVSLVVLFFLIYFISKRKLYLYIAFALTVFFSNPFIAQTCMAWYETKPVAIPPKKKYDALILLGGFTSTIEVDGKIRPVYSDGNDRMMQAIELFRDGISNCIIYSAGRDSVFNEYLPESVVGKQYLVKSCIPDSCILIESVSINTYENAKFTRTLLEKKIPNWQQKHFLLLSSGFHLPRAIACFQKQGIPVDAYATDIRSIQSKFTLLNTLMPTYGGFEIWTFLLKEWIGIAVYKLKGYC